MIVSRGYRIIWDLLSSVGSILGFINLIRETIEFSLHPIFENILQQWDNLLSAAFDRFVPYVILLIAQLGFDVTLYQHWKYVLVILWLYFLTHAKMALSAGNIGAALWTASWGSSIAFVAAVVAGSVPIATPIWTLLIPAAAVGGVFVYGTGNSLRAATFYRPDGQSWASAFRVPFRHSLRFLVVGSLALSCAFVAAASSSVEQPRLGVIVLIVLFFMLAVYRIIIGPKWGWTEKNEKDSWWVKRRRSGEAKIGFWMLRIIIGTFVTIIVGIYLK